MHVKTFRVYECYIKLFNVYNNDEYIVCTVAKVQVSIASVNYL